MQAILPKNLILLAKSMPLPLYVVGGSVRDFLLGRLAKNPDWDICSPCSADDFARFAQAQNFTVKSVYKNTGTVKLQDGEGVDYEYSCFRSDKYIRGKHTPVEIFFTDDITLDSKRRDFTCNAIYYDIQNSAFVDPLSGIPAIKEGRLTTVDNPDKVFGEDGLRLMRLARQAAQLGFIPDEGTLLGAKHNAKLIEDITAERIFTELSAILLADTRYGVENGHYHGVKILDEIGVLDYILPELTLGRNMAQRADFHKYDVLEHSLRALLYAHPSVRLVALLHDIGKPVCTLRDGNTYAHHEEGATLARTLLQRLKAPKKTLDEVCTLILWHMYDLDCKVGENKLRRFLVRNHEILPKLLLLKQADFSACKDNLSTAPTVKKWQDLYQKMQKEKVPFSLKELSVKGNDLLVYGIPAPEISKTLRFLLDHTAVCPADNDKIKLLRLLPR